MYPPFSGTLIGGRIYGRGAIDNKSGIAAALYALAVLAEHTAALPAGRAQLVCVPDEESGATGELGIKVLARTGLLQGRGAIYTYAGSDILPGHRGVLRYRLTCRGEAIHTGSHRWQHQQAGANAVTGLARLLLALEAIQFPSSSQRFFEQHRTILTPGTLIRGGSGVNIVPDHCEALLDIRTTPEIDRQQIESRLEAQIAHLVTLQPRLTYQYECLTHIPAVCSNEHAALFAILDRVVGQVRQQSPIWKVAGPANDGIPTACGLGPLGANAHAANEYVEVDSLVEVSLIYALTARQLAV